MHIITYFYVGFLIAALVFVYYGFIRFALKMPPKAIFWVVNPDDDGNYLPSDYYATALILSMPLIIAWLPVLTLAPAVVLVYYIFLGILKAFGK